jgi:4-aminobutyrate aminotransferase-like enzyme
VRQQGLAIGIEVWTADSEDTSALLAKRVATLLRAHGVVINSPIGRAGDVLRLAPAVNMPSDLAVRALDALDMCLSEA